MKCNGFVNKTVWIHYTRTGVRKYVCGTTRPGFPENETHVENNFKKFIC